ncbi:hypothetical protein PsorP6_016143 [Peronosclerospora sorghi]|uniref:Uncharacterized protein n=1 Tax=Peronosclerospora sorghi TaxID=230839 RepID=A0ACC0VQS1_9STRA|nr:hypothetical protein PsorP6_016143 [Peronosclerospora sorghi]
MKNSAELLEKFQRERRSLRASILAVLLIDAMTENLDEDEKQELQNVKRSFAWVLSSSVEALNEKTSALLSTLHYFEKERKGIISKSDLARVSVSYGKHMSENELNEMLVGASGDPEQNASSVEAIYYDNVRMTISTLQSAKYRPGEAIIREGHAGAHNVYLLLDGEDEVICKNPIKKVPPTNVTDEDVPSTNMSESRTSWSGVQSETSRARETKLRRLPKGTFFGEIELYTPRKGLQLVADDFLNLQGTYDSIKARLEKTAHRHIQQHLLKCVEAAKGSGKMRTLNTGDFIYKEGDPCDSVFILLDGQVEVLNTK